MIEAFLGLLRRTALHGEHNIPRRLLANDADNLGPVEYTLTTRASHAFRFDAFIRTDNRHQSRTRNGNRVTSAAACRTERRSFMVQAPMSQDVCFVHSQRLHVTWKASSGVQYSTLPVCQSTAKYPSGLSNAPIRRQPAPTVGGEPHMQAIH